MASLLTDKRKKRQRYPMSIDEMISVMLDLMFVTL